MSNTPSNSDYLKLSNAVYGSGSNPTPPAGWTLLAQQQVTGDGMFAAAFKNSTTGAIVVAFEGTDPLVIVSNPSLLAGQVAADTSVAEGQTANRPTRNSTANGSSRPPMSRRS